jgi:hypothetical protein
VADYLGAVEGDPVECLSRQRGTLGIEEQIWKCSFGVERNGNAIKHDGEKEHCSDKTATC